MKKNHKKYCWNVENGIFWRIWVCKSAEPVLPRGKSNSTRNAYKIIVNLTTRAKVMVLWSFTKNQPKIFLNLLTQTIPTAPAIFPIKINVLEVGEKYCKSKQAPKLREQKSRKMKKNHKTHCWNIENGIFWRIWVCKPAEPVLPRREIKFHPKCI